MIKKKNHSLKISKWCEHYFTYPTWKHYNTEIQIQQNPQIAWNDTEAITN